MEKHKQKNRKEDFWKVTAILFMVIILVLILLLIRFSLPTSLGGDICVPRVAGHFRSLDENIAVAVMDLNDKYQAQLSQEVANAFTQIKKLS